MKRKLEIFGLGIKYANRRKLPAFVVGLLAKLAGLYTLFELLGEGENNLAAVTAVGLIIFSLLYNLRIYYWGFDELDEMGQRLVRLRKPLGK